MLEHLIRLRGGWLWGDREGGPEAARRVALPLEGRPTGTSQVSLTRHFGRPPLDSGRERLAIRLEGVDGLVGIRLNDRAMSIPPRGATDLELSPDDLKPSGNVLVLEVVPTSLPHADADGSRWGMVALVIRRPHPPDVSGPGGGLLGDGRREA